MSDDGLCSGGRDCVSAARGKMLLHVFKAWYFALIRNLLREELRS